MPLQRIRNLGNQTAASQRYEMLVEQTDKLHIFLGKARLLSSKMALKIALRHGVSYTLEVTTNIR
jgi:hypothetical protein